MMVDAWMLYLFIFFVEILDAQMCGAMLRYSIYLLRGKSLNESEPLNFQELNPS